MEHEDSAAQGIDAATAARLLETGEEIGTKVYESIDFRTQMLVQAGTAAAIFVCLCAFFFMFGGATVSTTLIIPVLTLSYLTYGVRERLRVTLPTHYPRLGILLVLLALVPFFGVAGGMLIGQTFPWWVLVVVAACPALQPAALAVFSARSARLSEIGPLPAVPWVPLSDEARMTTVGIGVLFGVAVASAAFSWGSILAVIGSVALLAVIALHRTRWGLPAVGSEWGRAQWLGFSASFVLVMALPVALTAVPDAGFWHGIVGIAAGLATAAPLAISAFIGSAIHERPEEIWHASPPQS